MLAAIKHRGAHIGFLILDIHIYMALLLLHATAKSAFTFAHISRPHAKMFDRRSPYAPRCAEYTDNELFHGFPIPEDPDEIIDNLVDGAKAAAKAIDEPSDSDALPSTFPFAMDRLVGCIDEIMSAVDIADLEQPFKEGIIGSWEILYSPAKGQPPAAMRMCVCWSRSTGPL